MIKVYTGYYAKLRARLEVLTLGIKMDQYIRHWVEKSENVLCYVLTDGDGSDGEPTRCFALVSEFKKKGETAYILAYHHRGYANVLMQHIFDINPEVVSLCNTRNTGLFLHHCGFKYLGDGEFRHTVLSG